MFSSMNMTMAKAKQSTAKIYVIRKVVRARSLKEALKNEPKGKIVDIVQTINNKNVDQLMPAIGFAPPTEVDDDDA